MCCFSSQSPSSINSVSCLSLSCIIHCRSQNNSTQSSRFKIKLFLQKYLVWTTIIDLCFPDGATIMAPHNFFIRPPSQLNLKVSSRSYQILIIRSERFPSEWSFIQFSRLKAGNNASQSLYGYNCSVKSNSRRWNFLIKLFSQPVGSAPMTRTFK